MTPIARYQELQAELNPIQGKLPHDNKWFEVGSDRKLFLCNRHYWSRNENFSGRFFERIWDCFCRIQQCIRRLFCNPYPILEKKIHDLTGKINEYLETEDNPKRRSGFLDQYGPAVSQLIQSASTLQDIGRLQAPVIGWSKPICQWMLAETKASWSESLQTNIFFSAKNENLKYPVQFDLGTHKGIETNQQNRFTKPLSEGDWTVSVEFEHNDSMVLDLKKAFRIVIYANGEMAYEQIDIPNPPYDMLVYIENHSQFDLSLELKGFTEEKNTKELHLRHYKVCGGASASVLFPTTISPDEKAQAALNRSRAEEKIAQNKNLLPSLLPPKPDGILDSLLFNVKGIQQKKVRFGCRSGEYTATLKADGKLDVDIKAHRVIEKTFPLQLASSNGKTLKVSYPLPLVSKYNNQTDSSWSVLEITNNSENLLDPTVLMKAVSQGSVHDLTFAPSTISPHQTMGWAYSNLKTLEGKPSPVAGLGKFASLHFDIAFRELATE